MAVEIDAQLQVEEAGGAQRQLRASDFGRDVLEAVRDRLPAAGAASEASLAALLTRFPGALDLGALRVREQNPLDISRLATDAAVGAALAPVAREATQAAVRAAVEALVTRDFATQATLEQLRAAVAAAEAARDADATALQARADVLARDSKVEEVRAAVAAAEAARDADAGALQARADQLATEATVEQARAAIAAAEVARDADATAAQARLDQLATQTTLEALRAQLEAEDFSTAAGQQAALAVLEAVRDTVYRRTDPLPAGTNNIGFTSPSISQKVGQGRLNIAGSGRLTLATAGNVRATFSNPAGSGRTLSIVRLSGLATSTGWAAMFVNPTAGTPSTAPRPRLNGIVGGGLAGVGELRVDTSATTPLGGGVDTGVVIGVPAGERLVLDLPPIVLAPGVTLGVNLPFAGVSDTALTVYWVED